MPALLSSTIPKPDVILHLGLAEGRTFYALERQSCRNEFHQLKDVDGKQLTRDHVEAMWSDCPRILKPSFEVSQVFKGWRSSVDYNVDLRTSDDPGNFLCGFIYFTSMAYYYKKDKSQAPVMFLHVPNLVSEGAIAEGRAVAVGLIRALAESLPHSNNSDDGEYRASSSQYSLFKLMLCLESGVIVPEPQ